MSGSSQSDCGAEHNLKTSDAIQAATAHLSHATGLISNDPAFLRVKQLEVLMVDTLLDIGRTKQ